MKDEGSMGEGRLVGSSGAASLGDSGIGKSDG
jgi:hypothetical protein